MLLLSSNVARTEAEFAKNFGIISYRNSPRIFKISRLSVLVRNSWRIPLRLARRGNRKLPNERAGQLLPKACGV